MKSIILMLCVALVVMQGVLPQETMCSMMLSSELLDANRSVRMTYMLVHANWIHLAINLYALLTLVFLAEAKAWQFMMAVAISSIIPSALISGTPMCGISVVSYALTGILIMQSKKWWWLMVINALLIGAQAAMPNIAFVAHLYGFVAGVIVGSLYSIFLVPRYE